MTYTIQALEIGRRKADSALFLYLTDFGVEIEIAYRLWLLRGPAGLVVVDTGPPLEEAHRRGITNVREVDDALAEAGVAAQDVRTIVLTHLHWDHAGGLCRADGSLAFPRAEHVIGAACLAHARSPAEKDAGSFRAPDVDLLLREGKVRLWQEGDPLAPGLTAYLSRGHTEGLLIPLVEARDDGPPLAFPTDLVPTRSHLKPTWVMAYDNQPVVSVAEKRALFADLGRKCGGLVL